MSVKSSRTSLIRDFLWDFLMRVLRFQVTIGNENEHEAVLPCISVGLCSPRFSRYAVARRARPSGRGGCEGVKEFEVAEVEFIFFFAIGLWMFMDVLSV